MKTAFLNGDLKEDVYVSQPKGFKIEGKEAKVYKLKKALYGLRRAPRAWNEKLNKVFTKCSKEPSLYLKKTSNQFIFVYVDDPLVSGSCQKMSDFKNEKSANFDMSDLGLLTYYLGIEVDQREDRITLKHDIYAKKILSDTDMEGCNATHTPLEFGLKLSKAQEERSVDESE